MSDDPIQPPVERLPIESLYPIVEEMLEEQRFDQARTLISTLHPAEIAELMRGISALQRNQIFDLLDPDIRPEVLVHLEESDQEQQLERMTDRQIGEVLDQLNSDDAADVAGLLDDAQRTRILTEPLAEGREDLEHLLTYDEESAGGLMAVELVSVRHKQTVSDAVEAVRHAREAEVQDIHYVYVVDDHVRPIGRVSILELMLASRKTPIYDILEEQELVTIPSQLDQEEVAHIFARYDLISAPVVDDQGRLIGRITIDDIVDVISDEAEEDMSRLAGAGEEEVIERNLTRSIRARLPWLLFAFFGELLSAVVLASYEHSLQRLIIIAFFVPLVIAVAGNVGVQSATIVVRGLATGEIPLHHTFRRVGQELVIGLFNGVVISLSFALIVYVWKGDMRVALAVSTSLIAVVTVAAFTGSMVPFVLRKLKLDPANASGPFITMTNDVIGLLLYMIITTSMLAS